MSDYAHPEFLVSTAWATDHLNNPKVKFIEVDVDTTAYDKGHLAGAIGWNWRTDLNDRLRRDIIDAHSFAELNRRFGIHPDDTIVFYGDNNNWFAAWALWLFKYYRHNIVYLLNGGRKKWELEKRPLAQDTPPPVPPSNYPVSSPDETVRAYRRDVEQIIGKNYVNLVDVRSPEEFTGKIIAPPNLAETAQRAGHIPGAKNIPWAKTVNEDGSFKGADELRRLYTDADIDLKRPTTTYCRIGERSSHSWFVLKYLLGINDVKNYDGSWTEWGNLIGAPIEVGEAVKAA
jgi:thiosulfate/3-mercaptopyruvate sulfurtransferase